MSFAIGFHMPEPPPDSGQRLLYVQTRGLLEHCLRVRVSALDNVEVRYGTRVDGVLGADGRVRGVTLGDGAHSLEADLGVDALGRGSKTPAWLQAIGYAPAAEETVECDFASMASSRCCDEEFGRPSSGSSSRSRSTRRRLHWPWSPRNIVSSASTNIPTRFDADALWRRSAVRGRCGAAYAPSAAPVVVTQILGDGLRGRALGT